MAPLTGHYHVLLKGTVLPEEVNVIADGIDVVPNSTHGASPHTFYPPLENDFNKFSDIFVGLPWKYGGRKK